MDESTMLYRAVRDSELADIDATGTYRLLSGVSAEGKYFFETARGVAGFAKKMYQIFPQEGPYTMTSISVPNAALHTFTRVYVAGEGTVIFVPGNAFPMGPVQILDYAFLP